MSAKKAHFVHEPGEVKQCSKCGEWWLDGQDMPASTSACTHNWMLTSLGTASPISKRNRDKIRRRLGRRRAPVRNVVRGAVIVISVVFVAAVLVLAR